MNITHQTITEHLKTLQQPRKDQIIRLIELFEQVTKRKPKLWGTIIGFGKLYYQYPTGHDGYMPILALANRKLAITLYLSMDIAKYPELKQLGRFTIGKSCLYIKRLTDIDWRILSTLVKNAYKDVSNYTFTTLIE